jgi:hypothetical protein
MLLNLNPCCFFFDLKKGLFLHFLNRFFKATMLIIIDTLKKVKSSF